MARALAAYREAARGMPRRVWALSLVVLVNRAGTMVLPFLALYLTGERGLTADQTGLAMALYGVGALAGVQLGGVLADRLGPSAVQAASLLGGGALFLLLGRVETPLALYATLLALSAVNESFRPANAAALAAAAPAGDRVRAFGIQRQAINLGMTIGPVVGGVLARVDYAWLFRVDAATCFAAVGLLWALLGRGRGAAAAPAATPAAGPSPWRDGPYLVFVALATLLGCVFFQLFAAYPLTLRDLHGLTEDRIGLLFALNTVVILAFELVLIQALRARSPLAVTALGALATGGGLALVAAGPGAGWAVGSVLVWTAGEMLWAPMAEGWAAERAPEASRGRYMGVYASTYSIAFALGPAAGTWIYAHLGRAVLWWGCAAAGVALAGGFLALERATRRAPAPG